MTQHSDTDFDKHWLLQWFVACLVPNHYLTEVDVVPIGPLRTKFNYNWTTILMRVSEWWLKLRVSNSSSHSWWIIGTLIHLTWYLKKKISGYYLLCKTILYGRHGNGILVKSLVCVMSNVCNYAWDCVWETTPCTYRLRKDKGNASNMQVQSTHRDQNKNTNIFKTTLSCTFC